MIKRTPSNEIIDAVALVDANGDQFNKTNPMPTVAVSRSFDAKIWDAPIITKTAVSAKYSAILIWNPADSGISMSFASLTAWVSTTNRVRAVRMVTDPTTLSAVWTEQTGVFANTKVIPGVDSRVCPFKAYTAALDAVDPATYYNADISSTAATGTNAIGTGKLFTPGTGVIIVCSTANITLNAYVQAVEEAL